METLNSRQIVRIIKTGTGSFHVLVMLTTGKILHERYSSLAAAHRFVKTLTESVVVVHNLR